MYQEDKAISWFGKIAQIYWPGSKDETDRLSVASKRALAAFCLLAGFSGLLSTALNLPDFWDYPSSIIIGFSISLFCLLAPIGINPYANFSFRARILGYFTVVMMAGLSYVNATLISSVNVFLIPCVMTFTLALGWRDGLITLLLIVCTLIISFSTSPDVGRIDSSLPVMLGALIAAALFGYTGSAIFRREMTQSVKAVQAETKNAQAASEAKTRFLANMSHEIRTPLNGIIGMTELMRMSDPSPKQVEYLDVIQASADALATLVTGVLDVAKIESGTLDLTLAPMNLQKTLENAQNAVTGLAYRKDLSLILKNSTPKGLVVVGDAGRLGQILINLMGNAVKFTQRGSVTLHVENAEGCWFRFTVSDTGPGIAADQQSLIFERFRQAEAGMGLGAGGTGLGLSIAQDLVSRMGGNIEVISAPGEGASFTFEIEMPIAETGSEQHHRTAANQKPITDQETLEQKSQPQPLAQSGDAPKPVLLAEDNKINQLIIQKIFNDRPEFQLTCVENGQTALEHLASNPCSLVLMDVNMPVMGGDEAIERIRAANKPFSNIPIIMLTANSMDEQREQSIKAGANDFLTKPIQIDAFWEAVRKYLPSGS